MNCDLCKKIINNEINSNNYAGLYKYFIHRHTPAFQL